MNKFSSLLLLILGIVLRVASVDAQQLDSCQFEIKGHVYDRQSQKPLPYATIAVANSSIGVIADEEGFFEIPGYCEKECDLIVSFLGYKALTHHHDSYHEIPNIYLARDEVTLESIVVEGAKELSFNSIATSSMTTHELDRMRASSLGDAVSHVPGVTMLSTGQNIVTPVIHGLHGSRILIVSDDIRHEYQNWGSDHAPEIDMSQVERLEVVKGAATVRYGPDALGGVLLVHPKELVLSQDWRGAAGVTGISNGRLGSSSLFLSRGFGRVAFNVHGDMTKQGDLRAPDYYLTNTGKESYNYGTAIRYHKGILDLEAKYSRFNQKLGVLRWSVNGNLDDLVNSMENKPSDTISFSYNIRQPFQKVDHQVFLLKGKIQIGEQEFRARYAYQANHRQEFGLRKGTQTPIPTIDLDLRVQSFDVDWLHPKVGNLGGQIGLQWQYHDNNNVPGTSTAQFVPNYNYQRVGFFAIENIDLPDWDLEFGIRYDYHHMSARGVFQDERYSQDLTYNNLTSSIGVVKQINSYHTFRFNIGNAWRPPNMAELYSFGRHESLYQYGYWTYQYNEEGRLQTPGQMLSNEEKPVHSEVGYKAIANHQYHKRHLKINTSIYGNLIQHYFYARPAGITRTTQGAFPYYIYGQDNALLVGGDAQLIWEHDTHYQSTFTTNYVWARNISRKQYFVNTPPLDLAYKLEYQTQNDFLNDLSFGLMGSYTFSQWLAPRVIRPGEIITAYENGQDLFAGDKTSFDFMGAPNGYFLLHFDVSFQKGHFSGAFQIQNLLNNRYRSYTDVMRYYANEAGRSFQLTVQYKL